MNADTRSMRARDRVLALGARTYVMAIVNLTDDSFSGDGAGDDIDAAARLAMKAASDGADIIDLGAESARADVPARDARVEADLLSQAVHRVRAETGLVISADTYKPAVAEAALQAGAHMINDISGLIDGPAMAELCARYGAALVVNYTWERPKVRPSSPPQRDDVVREHLDVLHARTRSATDAGLTAESIVVDPGIAFGKSHDEDLQVLRRLREFHALGYPLLVAASRKHFIGSVTGLPPAERDEATVAVSVLAAAATVDIVRVHNVPANVRAVRIADAILRGHAGEYAPVPHSWPWAASATPIAGTTISEA